MTQGTQSPIRQKDPEQWHRDMQQEVAELMQNSEAVCHRLFANGDLSAFLRLLSRLHHYDARNLLLIYDRHPNATCLGAFADWLKRCPNHAKMVLNEKGVKKGIRLLAPYTTYQNGNYQLIWFCVRQYDISQTNLSYTPPNKSPYVSDEKHLDFLTEALRAVLSYSFSRSLLLLPKHDSALPAQLPYQITAEAVSMRRSDPPIARLQYITEACAHLSAHRESLPSALHTLFAQCVCHCLFSIWGYWDEVPGPSVGSRIATVPQAQQFSFLDLLQRTVRSLEETIACAYHVLRKEHDTDLLEEDIAALLGFQPGIDL